MTRDPKEEFGTREYRYFKSMKFQVYNPEYPVHCGRKVERQLKKSMRFQKFSDQLRLKTIHLKEEKNDRHRYKTWNKYLQVQTFVRVEMAPVFLNSVPIKIVSESLKNSISSPQTLRATNA